MKTGSVHFREFGSSNASSLQQEFVQKHLNKAASSITNLSQTKHLDIKTKVFNYALILFVYFYCGAVLLFSIASFLTALFVFMSRAASKQKSSAHTLSFTLDEGKMLTII